MIPTIRGASGWREVRHKIDLVLVAHELLGEPEKRVGDASYWYCPFCSGSEPYLQITEGKSRWRCAGCNEYGDAVDLVRSVREVTFSKALEFLSRREFYLDENDILPESSVAPGEMIAPDESTGNNDNWIDDLFRDA
jgi:hypothetical protein